MSGIGEKIRGLFSDMAVLKSKETNELFSGRNLPAFIKDYIVKKFSDEEGVVDREALVGYLNSKMMCDGGKIKQRLVAGEAVNITCKFVCDVDLKRGVTTFTIPEVNFDVETYILPSLIEEHKEKSDLNPGENWGNITIEYIDPKGKGRGSIVMTSYKSFKPYTIDLDFYREARANFEATEEWIDLIISSMEYAPELFGEAGLKETIEKKLEFISRILIAVEPRLNMIELGPKETGKSYVYNNTSKYMWLLGSGSTTRARMFYNRATKQFGYIKSNDAVIIDEISTFDLRRDDELQSILKNYLEQGKANVDKVEFMSECGLGLVGNIKLTKEMKPAGAEYCKSLPKVFQESAMLDRFHGFIEGWKIPKLVAASAYRGWALNKEYFSEVLHLLRTAPEYSVIFDELVEFDESKGGMRDRRAVSKLATAYCKLLFPHITDLSILTPESLEAFKVQYENYCLKPAVRMRAIIREQCSLVDSEYSREMAEFRIRRGQ